MGRYSEEELTKRYIAALRMSTKSLYIPWTKDGTVLDENKSVKWNAEKVTGRQESYHDEVKLREADKLKAIAEAENDFIDAIKEYFVTTGGTKISREGAEIIWKTSLRVADTQVCGTAFCEEDSVYDGLWDLLHEYYNIWKIDR